MNPTEEQIKKDQEKYNRQKAAVIELLSFQPFNEIMEYFKRDLAVLENSIDMAKDADSAFMLVQQKKPIKRFLTWINNLSK